MAEASTLVFGPLGRQVSPALGARGRNPETITAAGRNPARLAELASAGFRTASVDLSDSALSRLTGRPTPGLLEGLTAP
ncbi:hypothetical protein [Amycolatopsis sp. GA6-003]|uniref:hypothetical protein n=1 Tax=Amycolatopsis sp. GA6-003 TaxID=2652444 RepID=UPI0039174DFC